MRLSWIGMLLIGLAAIAPAQQVAIRRAHARRRSPRESIDSSPY